MIPLKKYKILWNCPLNRCKNILPAPSFYTGSLHGGGGGFTEILQIKYVHDFLYMYYSEVIHEFCSLGNDAIVLIILVLVLEIRPPVFLKVSENLPCNLHTPDENV